MDRSDLGNAMLKNVKMQETKVKMETPDPRTQCFSGKTMSMKSEQRLRVKSEAASQVSTAASLNSFKPFPESAMQELSFPQSAKDSMASFYQPRAQQLDRTKPPMMRAAEFLN